MIKTMDPKMPAIAGNGSTPLTPEQIVEHLRMLRDHIPEFGPLPVAEAKVLQTAANVSPSFVRASVNTVGAAKPIADALRSDAPTLRADSIDVGRWSAVEDEMRATLKGVEASNLARRYRVGLAALQTYSIARQLVRKKEHADLLPFVEEMRRTNRLGKKRRVDDPENATNPAPVPPAVK